ncbi:MAG: CLI_3235 family bacteriocin precursor [Tepidibacter sp.]|jgi:putative bacteriocin precursor|nr:CLI_3235 family bacteriocin precursor [Tepidibacter sp.]MCT4508886.1 CLI_3235 family bacteriocin precursor [Tepidibacter sp.]
MMKIKKLGKKVQKNKKSLQAYWGNCDCYCSSNLYNSYRMRNGTGY